MPRMGRDRPSLVAAYHGHGLGTAAGRAGQPAEPQMDGVNVVRTRLAADALGAEAAVGLYKTLGMAADSRNR